MANIRADMQDFCTYCMGDQPALGTGPRRAVCNGERSGSVVECLTRDRRAAGSSLTGVTALWSLSKTHLS